MRNLLFIFALFSLISCKQNKTEEKIPVEPNNGIGNGAQPPKVLSFSENIEEAHNKTAFMMNEAVSYDIKLKFGGSPRLEGTVSMTTNSSKVRLDKADGTTVIFDGDQVYISPETAKKEGARFDIFTWQYFFAIPFKLTDPGTVWEKQQPKMLDSMEYQTAKLSFESNVGDSPDDWYVVYKDPETNRLKAAAYIVTFGSEQEKAEENPHAIVYSDYQTFKDAEIATQWSFHNWSSTDGFGEKLGEATISNVKFFSPEKELFKASENSELLER
ncbi:DUF6503 family protein [Christiangramia forsetii]|uniref:Uncharacterized protein n=2 Tax=Christiangramia forsetii TaxID=411153 RepID=A0M3W4_CHRFK|nr:DUF6503 family protein [Christiangramia forsetii]GGG24801.1 hypothetical protein GCM10011532_05170 [Christiangramia forsetii]CAL67309.1 hypothetical protein GFO_2344 [Christiangramia forsetii KT0803]